MVAFLQFLRLLQKASTVLNRIDSLGCRSNRVIGLCVEKCILCSCRLLACMCQSCPWLERSTMWSGEMQERLSGEKMITSQSKQHVSTCVWLISNSLRVALGYVIVKEKPVVCDLLKSYNPSVLWSLWWLNRLSIDLCRATADLFPRLGFGSGFCSLTFRGMTYGHG